MRPCVSYTSTVNSSRMPWIYTTTKVKNGENDDKVMREREKTKDDIYNKTNHTSFCNTYSEVLPY